MNHPLTGRDFVKSATAFSFGGAATGLAPRLPVVAAIGLGRGFDQAKTLHRIAGVEIAYGTN